MNGIKESSDSSVKDYPKDWKIKHLGDLGTFLRGKGISKSETVDSGIPCVRYGEIYTQHHYFIKEFNSYINKDVASKSERVYKGDLLFAGSGETMKEIGKSVALLSDAEAYAGGDIVILRPNNVNSLYLSFALNNGKLANERAKLGQGHSVVHVYSKDLKHLKIPLPSKEEQQKIVSILITWDKAIELKEKLIEQKKEQKKGLMQKLLTGEVRLLGFKGKWKKAKLGDLGKSYNGLSGKKAEDFGKGKPYIPYKTIFADSKIDTKLMDFVALDKGEKQNTAKYGDIFFTTSSETRNEVAMSSVLLDEVNEVYLNSFCFGYRLNNFDFLIPEFARFLFRSRNFRSQVFKLAQGSTRFNISKNEVMKISVQLPSVEEQKEIALILNQADKEVKLLEKQVKEMKEQKNGLMQNLLTGKIRVKV